MKNTTARGVVRQPDNSHYFIQPYHGVDQLQAAFPVADFFARLGADKHVLVHRDGDALTQDEKTWLTGRMAAGLPSRCHLFITPLSDVEHEFCQPAHVAATYGMSLQDAEIIVNETIRLQSTKLIVEFTNKRREAKDKLLRAKPDAPSAESLLTNGMTFQFVKGKTLFGQLLQALTQAGYNSARLGVTVSPALEISALKDLAAQIHASTARV